MIRKANTCCFTGHRIIAKNDRETLPNLLDIQIRSLINSGFADFISGGALGFDTMAALAVLKLKEEFPHIRLILALPCRDQADRWNGRDKEIYRHILSRADMVHYISSSYTLTCMMKRNRFMVDNSSGCIFYLTNTRSGTYKTVAYAIEQRKQLYNILAAK